MHLLEFRTDRPRSSSSLIAVGASTRPAPARGRPHAQSTLALCLLTATLIGGCAGSPDDDGARAPAGPEPGDKLALQAPGRPGDDGCEPLDLTCQSVARGNKLAAKINTPKHYGQLSTSTSGAIVSGMFLAGGIWIYVNFDFYAPDTLLHRIYGYDWSTNTWAQIGEVSAHPTTAALNYSNFDSDKATRLGMVDKEGLVLGVSEVAGDPAMTSRLLALPSLASCGGVGTGVNKSAVRLARILVDDIGSRIVGVKAEADAWTGMAGKCDIEASCHIELECLVNGVALGGPAFCDASKGFKNQCIRQPGNRKVLCTEFDAKGNVIGQAEAECIRR